jgi:hypothetical protein
MTMKIKSTNTTLKRVEIPASEVPARFGRYQLHVLEYGHVPGVLSGAELRGSAREYGDRYEDSRWGVRQFVKQYGVTDAIVLSIPGHPRVWVDEKTGQPVEIVLV